MLTSRYWTLQATVLCVICNQLFVLMYVLVAIMCAAAQTQQIALTIVQVDTYVPGSMSLFVTATKLNAKDG